MLCLTINRLDALAPSLHHPALSNPSQSLPAPPSSSSSRPPAQTIPPDHAKGTRAPERRARTPADVRAAVRAAQPPGFGATPRERDRPRPVLSASAVDCPRDTRAAAFRGGRVRAGGAVQTPPSSTGSRRGRRWCAMGRSLFLAGAC